MVNAARGVLLGGVEFDGHRWGPDAAGAMWALDLCARARRGDALAQDLLTRFGVEFRDADGRRYWPPEPPKEGGEPQ